MRRRLTLSTQLVREEEGGVSAVEAAGSSPRSLECAPETAFMELPPRKHLHRLNAAQLKTRELKCSQSPNL